MKRIEGDKKIGNESGRLGEEIACKFLEEKGFRMIDRNYRKKWGEIDIIAKNGLKLHFIEVKAVSCEIPKMLKNDVTHETSDKYRPEDNIHPWKLKRLARTIQSYLIENNVSDETSWCFDAITVKIDKKNRRAKVLILKDIII
ncbi:MAG TPA: YraN family protein [Candidatus Paceibacterota bacterium]